MGKQRKAEESKGKLGKQRKAGESRRKHEKKGKRGKVKESTEKLAKNRKKTLGRMRNIPSILKMSSEGSKRLTERSQVVLRGPQEAPKRAPRCLRASPGRQEIVPRASRDAFGTLPGRLGELSQVASGTHRRAEPEKGAEFCVRRVQNTVKNIVS